MVTRTTWNYSLYLEIWIQPVCKSVYPKLLTLLVLWGIMLITSTCTVISYHKWFMKTEVEVLDPDRLFFLILFGHTLSFIYKMDRFFLNSWIGSIVFLLSVAKQFPCHLWLSHILSFELCGLCSLEIAHGISISCFVFYRTDSSNLGSLSFKEHL